MSIPINTTFKYDFLEGKGAIAVEGLTPNKPIPDGVDSILLVGVGGNANAEIGRSGGLSMKLSFQAGVENGIRVIRPGASSDFLNAREPDNLLEDEELGIHLFFDGKAGAKMASSLPAGPAGFTFGVRAGSSVGYDRFFVVRKDEDARLVMSKALSGVRLPQLTGEIARKPAPREVLAFRYKGFLDMKAGLNWGYQIHGVDDFEFHDLEASVEYDVRLKAGVELNYRLAGDFEIETRRGTSENYVRLVVKKSRDRKFSSSGGFQADAGYKLNGLPDSADDWLITFLGADAKTALRTLDQARAVSDLNELEQTVGKILMPSVRRLAEKWLGQALRHDRVADFLKKLNQVVTKYKDVDDVVIGKIIHLYEDAIGEGRIDELRTALVRIRDVKGRDALKLLPGHDPAWDVLERLVGGDLFALFERNRVFSEVHAIAKYGVDFIDGSWQKGVRDLVDELKASLKLDELFGRLEKIDTAKELKALSDEQLQGLVERILGKSFDEIRDGRPGKPLRELRKTLNKIEGFKDKFAAVLRKSYEQSVSLAINYAYSRSSSRGALIDMEFDVSEARGRQLFHMAAHGKFKEVFARANLQFMKVHDAQLTHTLGKSSTLQINAFGWNIKRLVEVVSDTEHSLEAGDSGLVQVFVSKAALKRRVEKGGEILETNFLFQVLGENLRGEAKKRFLVKTLTRMAMEYRLLQIDAVTGPDELAEYLILGETLGLLPKATDAANEIISEFTDAHNHNKVNLGRVEARYVAKVPPESVQALFNSFSDTKTDKALTRITRGTCNRLMAARYIGQAREKPIMANIGFAYRSDENARLHATLGPPAFIASEVAASLPQWATDTGKPQTRKLCDSEKRVVDTLFQIERRLAERMVRLDQAVDDAHARKGVVSDHEIEKAAREFVAIGDRVDQFGPKNAFFGIVDCLVAAAVGNNGRRDSALILEITPEGSPDTIRKFLMSGSGEDPVAEVGPPAAPSAAATAGGT